MPCGIANSPGVACNFVEAIKHKACMVVVANLSCASNVAIGCMFVKSEQAVLLLSQLKLSDSSSCKYH